MIHINLNMLFYTHVEHSPTKTVYIKYYIKKQNKQKRTTHIDCSRNWVLILGWKFCEKRKVFSLTSIIVPLYHLASGFISSKLT